MRAATCRISQGVERRQQREAAFLLLVSLFRRLQGHAWSGRQGRAPPDESRHAHGEREKGQAGYLEGCLSHLAGQGAGSSMEEGKYFATIVRQKGSCWIRGALSGP